MATSLRYPCPLKLVTSFSPSGVFGEFRLLGPELGWNFLGKHRWARARPTFTSKKADPKVGHRQIHFRKATLASSTVLSLCLS